jgi:hypothetical protein
MMVETALRSVMNVFVATDTHAACATVSYQATGKRG